MLLKLLPDQVMRHWDEIKYCIEIAMPPHIEHNMLRVQEQLLTGELVCWMSVINNIIQAIITTQVINDIVTDTTQLLVFSFTAIDSHKLSAFRDMRDIMIKYARSRGCSRIVAYTPNDSVAELAQYLGADITWSILSWEVK